MNRISISWWDSNKLFENLDYNLNEIKEKFERLNRDSIRLEFLTTSPAQIESLKEFKFAVAKDLSGIECKLDMGEFKFLSEHFL